MSIDLDGQLTEEQAAAAGGPARAEDERPGASGARWGAADAASPTVVDDAERRVGLLATAAAVFLSGSAAGWMAGGLFASGWGRVVTLVGLLVGVGLVALSYRTRRPSLVQYLVLPLAIMTGAGVTFVGTSGVELADLPDLVSDVVRAGGLGQPPVPFDLGWRFVLVVVFAVVGAAATSLAIGLNRVNVGVFLPVPVLFGAALIQPKSGSLVASVVSLVLLVTAIALAYGAELARDGATTGQFELRRLSRASGVLVLVALSVTALNQAGFLFPEPQRDVATPPKKPTAQALATDRVLFTVRSDLAGPWRIGVLDVYRDNAFLLPPFDRSRLEDVPSSGQVSAPRLAPGRAATATFTLSGLEGHQIPSLPNARRVTPSSFEVAYDPRTQLLRLPEKAASTGMSYVVEALQVPGADELRTAGLPPPALEPFTDAPSPPPQVQSLLAGAPEANRWERLAFVRTALQGNVVTAGAGQPLDVPPSRVVQMLQGDEATPFEITAAEVLLARWAGVPARLGYGYFGGERKGDVLEVGPRQGGTWLEAYFEGFGWVPLADVPQRAKGSLSRGSKQANPNVLPSDELALTLYVPIKLNSIRHLYELVRYWFLVSLPFVLGAVVLWRSYPAALRWIRRNRRRRWAAKHGVVGRVAVAYGEFRDTARDLNAGDGRSTPLEFVHLVEPDEEHEELAWLVTRALWGDLCRDLRPEDADAAEEMGASVTRRLRRAQPATARLLSIGSTASLREPFSYEIPNLWPGDHDPYRERRGRRRARLMTVALVVPIVVAVVAGVLATGVFDRGDGPAADQVQEAPRLPDRLVPDSIAGLRFQREPSAEKAFGRAGPSSVVRGGRVFTVRRGDDVLGYLQVAAFAPGFDAEQREVRRGILDELATGHFQPQRVGTERIFFTRLRDETFRVWFPPGGRFFELFVARQGFGEADEVFAALIEYQLSGETPAELRPSPLPPDPRRGGDSY